MASLFKSSKKQRIIDKNKTSVENDKPSATVNKEAQRLIVEAKKFEQSESDRNKSKARWATGFAAAFGVVAVAEAIAIVSMLPLKTVEPYVIRVDNSTGYVDVARPLEDSGPITEQEAVARHFIAQYVLSRESHDWFMATHNYERVQALSADRVFSDYDRFIRSDQSPLEVLGRNRRAEVTITNITFVGEVAQVRFRKRVVNVDGTNDLTIPARNWIATINYQFINERMRDSARLLNPLNFRVVSYRVDAENGDGA